MTLLVGWRCEDLEKLYRNGLFGDQADPKRPPILEDVRRHDLTQVETATASLFTSRG
jgi:hypothetical protein